MNRQTSPDEACRVSVGKSAMARPIRVTTEDELELQVAMGDYKRWSGRQFPTWSEVFEVLQSLGYAKRIWRPVDPWSPLPPPLIGEGLSGDAEAGMVGWFSRVETYGLS